MIKFHLKDIFEQRISLIAHIHLSNINMSLRLAKKKFQHAAKENRVFLEQALAGFRKDVIL